MTTQFSSRLREGVCRKAAIDLINWVQKIEDIAIEERKAVQRKEEQLFPTSQEQTIKPEGENRPMKREFLPLTIDDVYTAWQHKLHAYEQAAETPVPFGRHKETAIGSVGKREARWILERLHTKEEITKTLAYVDSILDKGLDITDDAVFAHHLYRRDDRKRRALRVSRLTERILDPPGELIILGLLTKTELVQFRDELRELVEHDIVLDASLIPLSEALHEVQQVADDLRVLNTAFETFLYEKPDDYPHTDTVDQIDAIPIDALQEHKRCLDWFSPSSYQPRGIEKYVSEPLERRATERLKQAASKLKLPRVQPIRFIGTMRPGDSRGFALLVDRDTGEFVLAVKTRGQGDQVTSEEQGEHGPETPDQKHKGNLVYANFPETSFKESPQAPIELFPLEWGEKSGRKRFLRKREPFLRKIIDRQRIIQQQAYADAVAQGQTDVNIQKCILKDPPFSSAEIVMIRDHKGKPEFFVHLSVKMPQLPPKPRATCVIGFHEHDEGYSYAVIGLDGEIQRDDNDEELVGDLIVPEHVDPLHGAKRNSNNYVFEVANAIVKQAGTAYIAIQDISWQKSNVTLSREQNRLRFSRPSKRIEMTVRYKAILAGHPSPIIVRNISHVRDCSACLARSRKGERNLAWKAWADCPNCHYCQWLRATQEHVCTACGHVWELVQEAVTKQVFECRACTAQRIARHNTAVVVAQEALRSLLQVVDRSE